MKIRQASEADIPQILNVLKLSLGETSSQKTEAVWRYKHIDNPFGKSLILVAEEDDVIVGVRAFMRWKWQKAEKVFSSFRAVDTATDPKFQGKGIFKKLTLKALDLGIKDGDDFVFNTPNEQSKPGYLKMGWEIVDRIPVILTPFMPFGKINEIKSQTILADSLEENLKIKREEGLIFTPKDSHFLDWRYKNCILQDYLIFEREDLFVAAYVKKHKYFKELRISEFIGNTNDPSALKQISNWAKESKTFLITSSQSIFKIGVQRKIGPVLTLKDLNLSTTEKQLFKNISYWNNSLGDLELF